MNIKYLNHLILHSLIGKNDGVSIVIDQTVKAMMSYMDIPLGNIYFLAAHMSPRFNAHTDNVFWHKNEIHRKIIACFSTVAPPELDDEIHQNALKAKEVISTYVKRHKIDIIMAHNMSHPYNLVTAVGLGYFIEERRKKGIIWPKVVGWWHDSYHERDTFNSPNPVIQKYLRYLPGTYIDGLVFINSTQPKLARQVFEKYGMHDVDDFLKRKTTIIPNTSSIRWEWKKCDWAADALHYPPQDNYNASFFRDIGLISQLDKKGFSIDDAVILLQHTRVVQRKNIEAAIEFAFALEKKLKRQKKKKCVVLLVSGQSGDERAPYKHFLIRFFKSMLSDNPDANVLMLFGEKNILSYRDLILGRKYYRFADIPSIVAATGGLGVFFSTMEGFGNNLLEMVRWGLPVVINKYDIYQRDIEPLGFSFPAITNGSLSDDVVEAGYDLITDCSKRNAHVNHNLSVLSTKLSHKIIADKLKPLIEMVMISTPTVNDY